MTGASKSWQLVGRKGKVTFSKEVRSFILVGKWERKIEKK